MSARPESPTTTRLKYGAKRTVTITVVNAESAASYIHQPRISRLVTGISWMFVWLMIWICTGLPGLETSVIVVTSSIPFVKWPGGYPGRRSRAWREVSQIRPTGDQTH
jgi:hypothetical protein